MKSGELEKHFLGTYLSLRLGIAVIAILFPFLLSIGGNLYADLPLQKSMSAYYHAIGVDGRSMRDWFVGVLFAVGALLFVYKGFSKAENIALNVAGLLAIGIAIFPMPWNCEPNCPKLTAHGFCAVTFFLAIAFVCIHCSSDTLHLIQDEAKRRRFKRVYKLIGTLMVASPAIAFVLSSLLQQYESLTFYVEAAGIFAFAAYWLTKGREIRMTEADRLALQGALNTSTS